MFFTCARCVVERNRAFDIASTPARVVEPVPKRLQTSMLGARSFTSPCFLVRRRVIMSELTKRKERPITNFFKPVNATAKSAGDETAGDKTTSNGFVPLKKLKENMPKLDADELSPSPSPSSYATLIKDESWLDVLRPEFAKPYWKTLEKFLESEEKASAKVFPPKELVFRAFDSCAMSGVKVVIIGQDPYHDVGQAMGLCFSVPKGVRVPSSLHNIYKELRTDLNCKIPQHGDLTQWAEQGVLLLNVSLTVRAHQANSHSKKGWENFTDAAIRELAKNRKGLVFLLWGKNAQDKEKLISKANDHLILKCAHPSGLSAHRGFFGCKHFSQCNAFIEKNGGTPIDWQIEGPYRT
ncbi:Uracil-DNA glycosylase-like [Ostreococcus tauri]|uniref:Uracil-DNA glycosylase n=2 Tax=Ostreococcus tauri TaxID=70448 RepID=A0A090N4H5_OSTTA|nr:Uracil-DNA glycosylase-like [Ostreococcus tauri]CEF99878.1 Uracil-DNA glycosylase-like [Ostreococcus tauri]|eukprot:XP_003082316.2 Uracil-DNA glycosylase-like [Ostreococcus tauri]